MHGETKGLLRSHHIGTTICRSTLKDSKPVDKKEVISKTELPYDLPDQSNGLSLEILSTSIVAANATVLCE